MVARVKCTQSEFKKSGGVSGFWEEDKMHSTQTVLVKWLIWDWSEGRQRTYLGIFFIYRYSNAGSIKDNPVGWNKGQEMSSHQTCENGQNSSGYIVLQAGFYSVQFLTVFWYPQKQQVETMLSTRTDLLWNFVHRLIKICVHMIETLLKNFHTYIALGIYIRSGSPRICRVQKVSKVPLKML